MSINPKKYVDIDSQDTPIVIYRDKDAIIVPLDVVPGTEAQVIVPEGDVDGFAPVNVSAVTSAIDSNIRPENIKQNVSILGVRGTFNGPTNYRPALEVGQGGSLVSVPTGFLGVGGATDIGNNSLAFAYSENNLVTGRLDLSSLLQITGDYGCYYAFSKCVNITNVDMSSLTTINANRACYNMFGDCTGITSVDMSSLESINNYSACYWMFDGCTGITSVDLGSLTTVGGDNACQDMFSNCTGITSVDLSSLTTVSGGSACYGMFRGCRGITSVDISSLETVSAGSGCSGMFIGCSSLETITFDSLSSLTGNYAFGGAFLSCTSLKHIYFPALTADSFGSYTNQFDTMLSVSVDGCTVHFPSDLQSVIGSWGSVSGGFGGTNTTVLFDL